MTPDMSWSAEEDTRLLRYHSIYADSNRKWQDIAGEMGRTPESVRMRWRFHQRFPNDRLQPSPYPRYDEPLVMEGDALVIPDLELPYHNSNFVNRLLDLTQVWGIDQCILDGDVLHLNSLSSWEANWQKQNGKGGLDEEQEAKAIEITKKLPEKYQNEMLDLLDEIGVKKESGDPNVSEEIRVSKKLLQSLAQCFRKVDWIIGNHEGRYLRTLATPLVSTEITNLVQRNDWRIAPYYFSTLISDGEKFMVEHPKIYAKFSASKLVSKFLCHILMGHGHHLNYTFDPSGKFYAIEMGCACDEYRMPYVAQRHNAVPYHMLGAVIVRGGIPWLLHERVDWKRLAKI